ncbi:MAG: NAD(P)H-binding protein [Patescibacteria group bacterium]
MKIFITGSTGLVGRDVIPVLAKKHNLFLLIRNPDKKKIFNNLQNINFIEDDLENTDKFKEILKNCEVILHISGTVDPKKSMRINCELTRNLVAACDKKQKFIYVSSFNAGFKNPGKYALSKKMAEGIIQKSGLEYLIFRPTLMYNRRGNFYIAKLIKQIIKFPFAVQPGDGSYLLQPLLTDDFAKIVLAGLEKINNRIISVAGKEAVTIRELINMIMARTKIKPVVVLPLWLLKIVGGFVGLNREKVNEISEDKTMNVKDIENEFHIELCSIKNMLPKIIDYVKTT